MVELRLLLWLHLRTLALVLFIVLGLPQLLQHRVYFFGVVHTVPVKLHIVNGLLLLYIPDRALLIAHLLV